MFPDGKAGIIVYCGQESLKIQRRVRIMNAARTMLRDLRLRSSGVLWIDMLTGLSVC